MDIADADASVALQPHCHKKAYNFEMPKIGYKEQNTWQLVQVQSFWLEDLAGAHAKW